MNFTPRTEKEIKEQKKPLVGIFPGIVKAAEACESKKDNTPMIKLEVIVYYGNRQTEKTVWLHPKMEVLVYNFCKFAGLIEEYNLGSLTAELCEDKEVMVRLGIEKGKDGHADRSVIKDFVSKDTPSTDIKTVERQPAKSALRPPKDPDLDTATDDIPF